MAETIKRAKIAGSTSWQSLYTVPASTVFTLDSLRAVCESTTQPTYIYVAVTETGETSANIASGYYEVYNVEIPVGGFMELEESWDLSAGCQIWVKYVGGGAGFRMNGVENPA